MPIKPTLENLIPHSQRDPERVKEICRKAGVISGIKRRERAVMREMYAEFFAGKYEVTGPDGRKRTLSGKALMNEVIVEVLKRSDGTSVSMIKELREGLDGNHSHTDGESTVYLVDDVGRG